MTDTGKVIYAIYTLFVLVILFARMWREAGREVDGESAKITRK